MATATAYVGATFQLLFTAMSVAAGVFFATLPRWDAVGAMALMAGLSAYAVVKNDWPRTWKPLLTKKSS